MYIHTCIHKYLLPIRIIVMSFLGILPWLLTCPLKGQPTLVIFPLPCCPIAYLSPDEYLYIQLISRIRRTLLDRAEVDGVVAQGR